MVSMHWISLKGLYAWLDSRVCMAGLISRVCPGGTKCGAVDSSGDHSFGGGEEVLGHKISPSIE